MPPEKSHNIWQIARAKAAFSRVISKAATAPQIIKNRDQSVAVIVSMADFETLEAAKFKWREFAQFSQNLAAKGDLELSLPSRELTPPQF